MNRRKFLQNSSLAGALMSIAPQSFAAKAKKGGFRVCFLSDVHVKPTPVAEKGMRTALRHINGLKPSVDFIINGGDAIMDSLKGSKEAVKKQWDCWDTILKEENKLPIRHCIGNHDIWGWQNTPAEIIENKKDPLYEKGWVLQQHKMENRFYSFEHKDWKFIVLDSSQESNGSYIALIDEPQFAWLEKELKETDPSQHVCIVSHIPIVSFCAAMFIDKNEPNGDWKILHVLLHIDARRITDMFKAYKNIRCCLSGHIHLQDAVDYRGIKYYCNNAISGNWWSGAFKDFDPAYAVFEFNKDGSVTREIVPYGFEG